MLTNSILEDIRVAVGLGKDTTDFDTELVMYINSFIAELNQNGVGLPTVVTDVAQKWSDLMDPSQMIGNQYFHMVPLYIKISTKILFDPPPPSSVELHANTAQKLLWRLKFAYEEEVAHVPIEPI